MPDLEDLERRIKRLEDKIGFVDKYPYSFGDLAAALDHRTWEQIWQGMDTRGISLALIGLNREQLLRLRPTFSKTRWLEITKELVEVKPEEITEAAVQSFRKIIMERIHELENMGEIVVGRGEGEYSDSLDPLADKTKETFIEFESWLHSVFEKA